MLCKHLQRSHQQKMRFKNVLRDDGKDLYEVIRSYESIIIKTNRVIFQPWPLRSRFFWKYQVFNFGHKGLINTAKYQTKLDDRDQTNSKSFRKITATFSKS